MVALCYLAAIVGAEALGLIAGVGVGGLSQALLVLVLLNHCILRERSTSRPLLLVLALIPLSRVLGLAVPMRYLPPIYWYAAAGVPLFIAVALVARALGIPVRSLASMPKLAYAFGPPQMLFALSGLPLSLLAFAIGRPKPIEIASGIELILAVIILLAMVGALEEITYRGMLQDRATELFGRQGLLYVNALFAAMHFGSLSWLYVPFIALVGLLYSWWVWRTGTVSGVALSHGLLSIGAIVLWPMVWPSG